MSNYSTELRYIRETQFDLGMSEYPVISEAYRKKLNKKILDHYNFHEIGFETAARFKYYLNSTLNEIMVYYTKLLESELIKINPLLTFERKTVSNKDLSKNDDTKINDSLNKQINNDVNQIILNTTDLDNTASNNSSEVAQKDSLANQDTALNTSNNKLSVGSTGDDQIYYDTPQGSLGDITTSNYATNVTKKNALNNLDETEDTNTVEGINKKELIKNSSEINSNTINNTKSTANTNNSTNSVVGETSVGNKDLSSNSSLNEVNVITENGFEIPLTELIVKYRQTFLNIDVLIINELKDLFMMIY